MAGSSRGLKLFSQSALNPPADSPNKVAACPTADLTASVSGANAVYIRRRGGEVVSKLAERNKDVQAIAWKSDGEYLAVAWSDGVVRLVGLETPKTVSQIRLYASSPAAITYISWAKNMAGSSDSWRTVVVGNTHCQQDRDMLDLPQALLRADVEQSLTKLPPLPVSGGSGDDMFVFSTQTSLDFMFRAPDIKDSDYVHVMVLGTADNVIHVSIYDTFVMGTFTLPLPSRDGTVAAPEKQPLMRLTRHASHGASSTHVLLLTNEDADNTAVYLAPMDFTFIYLSPYNLSTLASKTTTFHKLVRYIQQTFVHMQGEWQNLRELPSRFLASIQEDLQHEPRHKNIVHAFRAAALTGYVSPTLKQWLIDTIAERGHKRWDKAVSGSLQSMSDLIHNSLLPAIERSVLALGRLKGLAEHHSCDGIGFTVGELEPLSEIIDCLLMSAQLARVLLTAELGLFVAFSAWLRSLIVRLALPGQAEDQADKEPVISMTPVLDYITNHMVTTPLEHFFGKTTEAEWNADWETVEGYFASKASTVPGGDTGMATGEYAWESLSTKLHEELNKAIGIDLEPDFLGILQDGLMASGNGPIGGTADKGKQSTVDVTTTPRRRGAKRLAVGDDGEVGYMKAFLRFDFLIKLFSTRADAVLKNIAQSGRQNVGFGPLSRLSVGLRFKKSEMVMTTIAKPDPADSMDVLAFTAHTAQEDANRVYLFRTTIVTEEGVSKSVSTSACILALADNCQVVDFQFAGSNTLYLLLAATQERNERLVAVPIKSLRMTFGEYYDGIDIYSIPIVQLTAGGVGLQASGLCWVANIDPPAAAENAGSEKTAVAAKKSKSNPIASMEVLGPRKTGSDKGKGSTTDSKGVDDDGRTTMARVCLMYADGSTYRVFTPPPPYLMFNE